MLCSPFFVTRNRAGIVDVWLHLVVPGAFAAVCLLVRFDMLALPVECGVAFDCRPYDRHGREAFALAQMFHRAVDCAVRYAKLYDCAPITQNVTMSIPNAHCL